MKLENIPGELKGLKQWVIWGVPGAQRPKAPYSPGGEAAKANDAATWSGFDEAVQAVNEGRARGIGFEFAGGYAGIDLDHVLDQSGKLADFAADIVQTMNSYTELSPSGTGLHILFRLNVPLSEIGGRNRDSKLGLEVYDTGRYFTVTGNAYGKPKPIADRTAELKQVYARYLADTGEKTQTAPPLPSPPVKASLDDLTDSELWDFMFNAGHGGDIRALYNCDIAGKPYLNDHSRADLALCNHLAFYTGRDARRMDGMFRQSGLMRAKWDERHGSQTYGEMTIQKAIDNCNNVYTPQEAPSQTKTPPRELSANQMQTIMQRTERTAPAVMTREDFDKRAVAYLLPDFMKQLTESREGKAIPTGFTRLDRELDGGLYPGLYIIGAISALGKTTFCTQILDQIAFRGRSVLVVSLEMSRNELIAKSLSRLTLTQGVITLGADNATRYARTTRQIMRQDWRAEGNIKDADLEVKKLYISALQEYGQNYARNIFITEGIGNVGVNEIKQEIEQFLQFRGEPPVILIDYLQLLAPYSPKLTDKQNVDKNVLELKRLSRDYQTPIIGISSFNRENYNTPVSMASFKESGAIEYSSDVLIGLQYKGMDYRPDEKESARIIRIREVIATNSRKPKGKPRAVMLKILKHRNGQIGEGGFNFYPHFNYFEEENKEEE